MQDLGSATFQEYLRSLAEESLEGVCQDYAWLSGLEFGSAPAAEFRRRRECCRQECARRGLLRLYQTAEQAVTLWAA
jgi:hypothetical protein